MIQRKLFPAQLYFFDFLPASLRKLMVFSSRMLGESQKSRAVLEKASFGSSSESKNKMITRKQENLCMRFMEQN
jgi:hypothetical protein